MTNEITVAEVLHQKRAEIKTLRNICIFLLIITVILILSPYIWTTVLGVVTLLLLLLLLIGYLVEISNAKKFELYADFYDKSDTFLEQISSKTNIAAAKIKTDLDALVNAKMLKCIAIYDETGQIIIARTHSYIAGNFTKYIPFYNIGDTRLSSIADKLDIPQDAVLVEINELAAFGAIEEPTVDEASNHIDIKTISAIAFPSPTGDETIDTLLQEGASAITAFSNIRAQISNKTVRIRIREFISATCGIFNKLTCEPEVYGQVVHFAKYYLPKTQRLLASYEDISKNSMQNEKNSEMLDRIQSALDLLVAKYKELHDLLNDHKLLDIESDLKTLEMMLELDESSK